MYVCLFNLSNLCHSNQIQSTGADSVGATSIMACCVSFGQFGYTILCFFRQGSACIFGQVRSGTEYASR